MGRREEASLARAPPAPWESLPRSVHILLWALAMPSGLLASIDTLNTMGGWAWDVVVGSHVRQKKDIRVKGEEREFR